MHPTKCRIVEFIFDAHTAAEFNARRDGNSVQSGDALPAIVVAVWPNDVVNLKVFRDAATDGWVTSVHYGSEGAVRYWRWPARG